MPLMAEWDPAWPTLEEWAKPSVDMVPHTGQLTDLATGAKSILEFGVRSGVSTLALLTGLDADGRMVSVDPDEAVPTYFHPALRMDPRFTLLLGTSLDPAAARHYPDRPDILMIDASHLYEDTLGELRLGSAIGARRIVLHDYLYEKQYQPTCAVKEAVDEFLADPDAAYEWEVLHPSMWGLAVLRRKP